MRSSTFSSSEDVPAGRWGVTWALALALVAGALAAVEVCARRAGFEPSVKDGPELWSAYRQKARTRPGAPTPLVLAGSSRFMLGIDPGVLAAVIGGPVVDLAMDGSLPFPVLEDLANDGAFRGTVLCEMAANIGKGEWGVEANVGAGPVPLPRSAQNLAFFRTRPFVSDAEALVRERLQSRLVFLLPELAPRELAIRLLLQRGHLALAPSYLRILPGRFRPADYSGVDLTTHQRHWAELFARSAAPATDADVLDFARRAAGWARRIEARGGQVFFMRMVSSGAVRAVEDRQLSRRQWNLFAAGVTKYSGSKAFHYEDVPSLRGFEAAEGSHLDRSVVDRFTRALGTELLRLDSQRSARAVPALRPSSEPGQPSSEGGGGAGDGPRE